MHIVEEPIIIENKNRKEGISAMLRVKNGEDYLRESIMSVIHQVDEIICVFNDSSDNTEKILCELELLYPKKIHVFKYIPKVYAVNTEKYITTDQCSVHSLAYYYNFTLSKTNYNYIFKLDDDEIFFPEIIRILKSKVNENISVGLRGLNLMDINENLFVNKMETYTGGTDTILFKYNSNVNFKKTNNYEVFHHKSKILRPVLSFYHLKRCKKDRGINNYNIENNLKSRYLRITTSWLNSLTEDNLISFEKFNVNKLTHPFSLGFKYINNSRKLYNYNKFNTSENNINIKTKDNIFIFGNGPQEKIMNELLNNLNNKLVIRINNFNEKTNGDNLYFDIICLYPLGKGNCDMMCNYIKNYLKSNQKILIARHKNGTLGAKSHYSEYFEKLINTLKQIDYDSKRIEYFDEDFFKSLQIKTGIRPGTIYWPTTGFCCIEYFCSNKKYNSNNIFISGFSLSSNDYKKDPFYKNGPPKVHPCQNEMKIINEYITKTIIINI